MKTIKKISTLVIVTFIMLQANAQLSKNEIKKVTITKQFEASSVTNESVNWNKTNQNALGGLVKEGEEVIQMYESPHPYPTRSSSVVWTQNIKYEGATYIALHFSKLQLANGDFLLIKSPKTEQFWKYHDRGNYNNEKPEEGFWSVPIYGDELIIEIHSENSRSDYGYTIDKFARGYTEAERGYESIWGNDDSLEAKCYQSSEPNVYHKSRSVVRLLINGTRSCTGWLIGDEGHIMTNNHCVKSSSDANNVTVEFMAEGTSCSTNCQSWFACRGKIEASSTTLIKTDSNLDYSLLLLPTNVSKTYGYLQLRERGASVGERIYIPQHPGGWGKRIALASDHPSDASDGFVHIQSVSEPRYARKGKNLGYYGDTQKGSSGAPVLGYSDHLVIGLHHCRGSLNKGVPIQEIIADLGSNLPNNAIGTDNSTQTNNVKTEDINTLDNDLKIYPNPTKGPVNIKLKDNRLDHAIIRVYSLNSTLVYSITIQKRNTISYQLDLSEFQTGVYLVEVTDSNGKIYKNKVVKK